MRHLPDGGEVGSALADGCGTREDFLGILETEFALMEKNWGPLGPGLSEAFWNQLRALQADAKKPGLHDGEWLPSWNFRLPPYVSASSQKNVAHLPSGTSRSPVNISSQSVPTPDSEDAAAMAPPAGPVVPVPGVVGASEAPPLGQVPPPARLPRSVRSMGARVSPPRVRFYTMGEVADHTSLQSFWMLADDGQLGFDVFDATDAVRRRREAELRNFDINSLCAKTPWGIKALAFFQQELKTTQQPLGKLLRPLRTQEIAERNGEAGKSLWITAGDDVFDLTNFPFGSDHERAVLTSRPGSSPMSAISQDEDLNADEVLERLWPYRCAVVAKATPPRGPDMKDEIIMTANEVGWYIYPEDGMYTIIDGDVYDLTGKPSGIDASLARNLTKTQTT